MMPRGGEGEPSDNLYIMGLPEGFDTDSVQQFFSAIGSVQQCKSFGYGYALVRFSSLQEAQLVKNSLSGQQPAGCVKPLVITYAQSTKKNDWRCPACGDLQFQKNAACRMCNTPRPTDGTGTVGETGEICQFFAKAGWCKHGDGCRHSHVSPAPGETGLPAYADSGDWTCTQCGDLQFKKNKSCRLCGSPPPAPGESPAFGKAKGKGAGAAGPYPLANLAKGCGKGKEMCTAEAFINELIVGGLPGGDHDHTLNLIMVAGLPVDCTDEHLYQVFATFGAVPPNGARIESDGTGQCNGTAAVNFLEATSADMAVMALNGIQLANGLKMRLVRK